MSNTIRPIPTPAVIQDPPRQREDVHLRSWERDPNWIVENDADISTNIRDLEDAAMYYLADALILSQYTKYEDQKAIEVAIRALRPLAMHSKKIKKVLDRLGESHGMLKFQPKGHIDEDWYESALEVVEARLRERKLFLKTMTLYDLRNGKRWAAEARQTRRGTVATIAASAARAA